MLHPYFTGLPILILTPNEIRDQYGLFQSLFYWIHYFYTDESYVEFDDLQSFNPYFTGYTTFTSQRTVKYYLRVRFSFNPYFTGLPILIKKRLFYLMPSI